MSAFVDIEKNLGKFQLRVKLQAQQETLALLGPSGCGKSMTLKCIAGIEKPDRGKILVDGVTLFDSEKKINLSPQERRVGLMFQNYALFPNMTVLQNIAAGAKRENNKQLRRERVNYVLETFELADFANRLPYTLSGGQQQRVALARILVSEPRILLLDEPFSALDTHLRLSLEQEVRQVIREFGKTVILVSHDRNEVYRMSDQVAVMEQGSIVEMGSKQTIFTAPHTLQSARLIGCENIIPIQYSQQWGIRHLQHADAQYLGVRASDLRSSEDGTPFRVIERIDSPGYTSFHLISEVTSDKCTLLWNVSDPASFSTGQIVKIRFPEEKLLYLRDGSEGKEL